GPGAHALSQSRVNDPVIPFRILMLEFPIQHPSHDLHVLVWMRAKSGIRLYHIIIVNHQQSMMGIRRIIMMAEAEAVPGVEPSGRGVKAIFFAADLDGIRASDCHDAHSFLRGLRGGRLSSLCPTLLSIRRRSERARVHHPVSKAPAGYWVCHGVLWHSIFPVL